MAAEPCPTVEEIAGFVDGLLSEERIERMSGHFDECPRCLEMLSSIGSQPDSLARLIRQASETPLSGDSAGAPSPAGGRPVAQQISCPELLNPEDSDGGMRPEIPGSRYEILGDLGRGGIGSISRARDAIIGRELAIKVLRPKHANRAEVVQRFTEEAQIAGQLQHPGIVPVYEMGHCSDGRPFFTMKRVNGMTLSRVLKEHSATSGDGRRLPAIFLQVCQAVAYAHSRSVVHRDLKPANIMVGEFGEVQVMDWGLAKLLSRPPQSAADRSVGPCDETLTVATALSTMRHRIDTWPSLDGTILGTPGYMAPEQALGETDRVGKPADVFSLGAILLEILTGEPPYAADNPEQLMEQVRSANLDAAWIRLDAADADAAIKSLARDCLQKDVALRPPDAGAVAARMEACLQSVETRLQQAEVAAAESRARAEQAQRTHRLSFALMAVVAVALMAAGYFRMERIHEQQQLAAQVNSQLEQILSEADSLLDSAQADPTRVSEFVEARLSVQRARQICDSPLATDALRRRVTEVALRLGRTETHRRVFDRLDSLRAGKLPLKPFDEELAAELPDSDPDEVARSYADALGELGLGYQTVAYPESVNQMTSLPDWLREAVIAGIDTMVLSLTAPAEVDFWVRLVNETDTHAERKAIRTAARLPHEANAPSIVPAPLDPANHSSLTIHMYGTYLAAQGRTSEAIRLYEEALPYHPTEYWINRELATILMRIRSDRHEVILRCLSVAAALRAASPRAQLDLMHALVYSRRHKEALILGDAIAAAVRQKTHESLLWRLRGQAYWEMGEQDSARDCLEQSVACEPGFSALDQLSQCYVRLQLNREAVATYLRLIELAPENTRLHYNLGNGFLRQREFAKAIAAYDQVLQRDPDLVMATINCGQAWAELGQFDVARNLFNTALQNHEGARDWGDAVRRQLQLLDRYELLQRDIPALESGALQVSSDEQRLEYARVSQLLHHDRTALMLLEELIANPESSVIVRNNVVRFYAARSAMRASQSADSETAESVNNDSARLRQRALELLQEEFRSREVLIEQLPQLRRHYALMLRQWQDDPLFAAVRPAPAGSPAVDAATSEWERFWNDVDAAFERNWHNP